MSITLNNSDFQCLQDQLVELKTKNYELAEKLRRSQADFEAAKAKICNLQLKLEEQERDFQVTSSTLRREIEAVSVDGNKDSKEEDYKAKYKKLLHKAKELQQRYEKSVEIVQQLDSQNKNLNEKIRKYEEDSVKLREELEIKQNQLDVIEKEYNQKLVDSIEEYKTKTDRQNEQLLIDLDAITAERDKLKNDVQKLTAEVNDFDSRLESQSEERKIHERKGLKENKELKRQLNLEKNRAETLQKRLEKLLSEPPIEHTTDLETRLSTSSSTNGNGSSNGNGSRTNQDTNSVGSWSFVPVKTKSSNPALNETLSLCSIDSEDRETVMKPCDTKSEDFGQRIASADNSSKQNLSSASSNISATKQTSGGLVEVHDDRSMHNVSSSSYSSSHNSGMLIEEQAALVDRLTKLQHDKWMLEEKLSYLEQANSSLSEDLANKSDIIKHYFKNQALRSSVSNYGDANNLGFVGANNMRRTSLSSNVNHLLSEKPSLKKVVDFLKERTQVSSIESESLSKEAVKKMQIMLEETLIKCLKLQENLDLATSELNKLRT